MNAALNTLDTPGLLALAAALGWASGLRLYLVVFATGLAGWLGWLELPPGLQALQHPALLGVSGFLLFIEFFADKIPYVDSLWDLANSVIRVPAGAALAAGALGSDSATMALVAALLGGTLAATSQAAKTSTRAAVNASPEPFSNVGMSLLEDGLVVGALWRHAAPAGVRGAAGHRGAGHVGPHLVPVPFFARGLAPRVRCASQGKLRCSTRS